MYIYKLSIPVSAFTCGTGVTDYYRRGQQRCSLTCSCSKKFEMYAKKKSLEPRRKVGKWKFPRFPRPEICSAVVRSFCICAGIWRDGQQYVLRTRCVRFSQMSITEWLDCGVVYKLYESMLRLVKDNENVDQRQHCFLLQTSSGVSRYFSMETKQGLLDVQCAWHRSICTSMMHIKVRALANCVCIVFSFGILDTILF